MLAQILLLLRLGLPLLLLLLLLLRANHVGLMLLLLDGANLKVLLQVSLCLFQKVHIVEEVNVVVSVSRKEAQTTHARSHVVFHE